MPAGITHHLTPAEPVLEREDATRKARRPAPWHCRPAARLPPRGACGRPRAAVQRAEPSRQDRRRGLPARPGGSACARARAACTEACAAAGRAGDGCAHPAGHS